MDLPSIVHWLAWAQAELERAESARLDGPGSPRAGRPEVLVFVLESELPLPEHRPGLGRVEARLVRQKQGGAWTRGKPIDPLTASFDLGLSMSARLCWATVVAGGGSNQGTSANLRPEHPRALDALAESGRCHLGRVGGPILEPGPALDARPRWRIDTGGEAALALELPGIKRAWIVACEPPRYIDLDSGRCGALRPDTRRPSMAVLAAAPRVALDEASVLDHESVRAALSALRLPLPQFADEHGVRARPVPGRVDLELGEAQTRSGKVSRLLAAVTVLYVEHELDLCVPWIDRLLDDRVSVGRGEVVQIERRVDDEHALAQALLGAGLSRHYEAERPFACDLPDPVGDRVAQLALELRGLGWDVSVDGVGFDVATVEGWWADAAPRGEAEGLEGWDVSVGVTVEGERLDLLPAVVRWIEDGGLPDQVRAAGLEHVLLRLDDGRHVRMPVVRLGWLVDTLVELCAPRAGQEVRGGAIRLGPLDARRVASLLDGVTPEAGEARAVHRLARALERFSAPRTVAPPRDLAAELRPYQRGGLDWMQWLRRQGLSGVLADEMGLGKTMQALAHVLVERRSRRLDRPCLVVAPTSVVHNWAAEATRFAPTLRALVVHGPRRERVLAQLQDAELVITSYALLVRDDWITQTPWHVVILDEAHAIKNDRTQLARAAQRLRARQRIALTGTPVENHLGELWSLMRWLEPGALGPKDRFNALFRRPIERDGDEARLVELRERLAPLMLRRNKDEVLDELPAKTEVEVPVELEGRQRDLYEAVRLTLEPRVRKALATRGVGGAQVLVLDALLKLRQTCCDPRLLPAHVVPDGAPEAAKVVRLLELVDQLVASGRKVLVFSQFTSMLGLIGEELGARGVAHLVLTGKIRHRAEVVERFESGEAPVFLLSLKAGGSGLNLTAADAVIHFDPWWNPAAEAQATDRAHRIGQTRPVTVFRLVTVGTVEARILDMHAKKRALARGLERSTDGGSLALTEVDVARLLAPLD